VPHARHHSSRPTPSQWAFVSTASAYETGPDGARPGGSAAVSPSRMPTACSCPVRSRPRCRTGAGGIRPPDAEGDPVIADASDAIPMIHHHVATMHLELEAARKVVQRRPPTSSAGSTTARHGRSRSSPRNGGAVTAPASAAATSSSGSPATSGRPAATPAPDAYTHEVVGKALLGIDPTGPRCDPAHPTPVGAQRAPHQTHRARPRRVPPCSG
jgi:hypothetical protein